jgi:opacity protein-like surface antigen
MKKAYIFALSLLAVPALADNTKGFYAGLGESFTNNHDDFAVFDVNASISAKNIKSNEIFGGYKYNDYLGAEVRYGSGTDAAKGVLFSADHQSVTGEVDAEVGKYKSIYYRPEMVNEEAKLYGLLGYTQLDTTVTTKDATGKELTSVAKSYSGFSYGVGIGFVFADRFNINFEYKNICKDLYDKANTATINLDYRF